MKISSWAFESVGRPLQPMDRDESPDTGQVVVQVAGCGVCHTDLGFLFEGVPTRHPLPLTLGHEVSGRVVEAGAGAEAWIDRDVIVPAVIPCGRCAACHAGRGMICPDQVFPGNDVHGGFATHLVVPAAGLCAVPDLSDAKVNPAGLELVELSVIADAVSTPYQAIHRSGLQAGDLAVFVGAGGVGGFGVQIAAARGARVVALDVDPERLATMANHGASKTLRVDELSFKELKRAVRDFAAEHEIPTWRQFVFETSGTPAGQQTAFGLLAHGGTLGVVGYTPERVEVRLSNLMALDASAQGNWGCLPEHYPAVVEFATSGRIALRPFIERRPLATVNEALEDIRAHRVRGRVVLEPEI